MGDRRQKTGERTSEERNINTLEKGEQEEEGRQEREQQRWGLGG